MFLKFSFQIFFLDNGEFDLKLFLSSFRAKWWLKSLGELVVYLSFIELSVKYL